MKIRYKLFIGFIAIGLITVSLGVVVFLQLNNSANPVENTTPLIIRFIIIVLFLVLSVSILVTYFIAKSVLHTSLGGETPKHNKLDDPLQQVAEEWQRTFDAISDLVFIQDKDFIITKTNKAFSDTLKLKPEDIIGKKCYTLLHNMDEPWDNCPFEQTRKDHKTHVEEVNDPHIGIPLLITTSPIFDSEGKFVGSVHIAKDITERKKTEESIIEEKQKFEALVTNIPGVVYRCANDANWTMEFISDEVEKLSGYPASDFIQNKVRSYASIIHPDDQNSVDEAVQDGVKNNRPYEIYYRIVRKDTRVRDVYEKGQGVFSASNEFLWLDGAIFDITERKKTEEALRESENRFRTIFESSRDAIMTLIPGGRFLSGNPATIKLFGCKDEDEFCLQEPAFLSPKLQPDGQASAKKAQAMMARAVEKGSHFFEWTHKRIDGSEFFATVLLTRMVLEGETILQATVRDITERKKTQNKLDKALQEAIKSREIMVSMLEDNNQIRQSLEENLRALKSAQSRLVQAEKMGAVGQLAVGVAHEINNPLFVIASKIELWLMDKSTNEKTRKMAEIILQQTKRIQSITERLQEFSRKKDIKREPCDINKIVAEALSLLSYQAQIGNIRIRKQLSHDILTVVGDKNQILEVFLNIMLNAVQAMTKKGSLTIKTYAGMITREGKRQTDRLKRGESTAVIEISDTGPGMDEKTLYSIFDPFFSTKPKGTGLGLSICYRILENHNGTIDVTSTVGKGSTFIIRLPCLQGG